MRSSRSRSRRRAPTRRRPLRSPRGCSLQENSGRAVVLELVVVGAFTRRPVRKVEVRLDRVALEMKLPAPLDDAQALEAVAVGMQLDQLPLLPKNRSRLLTAPQRDQALRLT